MTRNMQDYIIIISINFISSLSSIRNQEERTVSTKENSPKQGQASAEDLTTKLLERRESPYHRLD